MNELERKEILRLTNEESQRISRECLRTALFKLMGNKNVEKLSITEIVELAGVSRNAFYRNYGTKEALLEDLIDVLLAQIEKVLPKYDHFSEESMTRFYATIRERQEDFRIIMLVRNALSDRLSHENINYFVIAWKGAFTQMTIRWFENGMIETPEEMGRISYQILSRLQQPS